MRLPLARYSILDLLIIGGMLLAVSVLAWLYVSPWLAAAFLVLFAFVLFFFRDPPRKIPAEPGVLVSPADGTVVEIDQVQKGVGHDEFPTPFFSPSALEEVLCYEFHTDPLCMAVQFKPAPMPPCLPPTGPCPNGQAFRGPGKKSGV